MTIRAWRLPACVLAVFALLALTIWCEAAIVAEAYEIRGLREREGELRNKIRIRRSEIEARCRAEELEKAAERLEIEGLVWNGARVVEEPVVLEPVPTAH